MTVGEALKLATIAATLGADPWSLGIAIIIAGALQRRRPR